MIQLTERLEGLDEIWAKSPIKEQENGELLVAHTWEVLSRLRELATLRPSLSKLYSANNDFWHVLFWAAFLHDWGKAAQGFQFMLRGKGSWSHRHEVLSLLFIFFLEDSFTEDEILAIISAIVSHHKDVDEINDLYPSGLPYEYNPITELVEELDNNIIYKLFDWLTRDAEYWINDLKFDELGVRCPKTSNESLKGLINNTNKKVQVIQNYLELYYRMTSKIKCGESQNRLMPGVLLRGAIIKSDHIGSAHTGKIPELYKTLREVLKQLGLDVSRLYNCRSAF